MILNANIFLNRGPNLETWAAHTHPNHNQVPPWGGGSPLKVPAYSDNQREEVPRNNFSPSFNLQNNDTNNNNHNNIMKSILFGNS